MLETRLLVLKREEKLLVERLHIQIVPSKNNPSLTEIDEQLKAEKQAYLTKALTDLSSIDAEIAEITVDTSLENTVDRTSVRSPIDGVVNKINYVTADIY